MSKANYHMLNDGCGKNDENLEVHLALSRRGCWVGAEEINPNIVLSHSNNRGIQHQM
jgi:hypothetical protein